MRAAVITVAGISSRFNEGVPESEKRLKAIYGKFKYTLLYKLLGKCSYADRIVVVGGYCYDDLEAWCGCLEGSLRGKVALVRNVHYADLGSGYSLWLGIREALASPVDEVLFVEGDLDIDKESFGEVVGSPGSVLTYTHEPIYADKAVVLYRDGAERWRYAFNSSHGLLRIDGEFSCILNSGQVWKFSDIDALRRASDAFIAEERDGTNLRIVQRYLDTGGTPSLVALRRWTNCNTREDYQRILAYWKEEEE